MFIRVRVVGTGTEDDPFRVPLATYRMVRPIDANNRVIVQIPDADEPDEHDDPGTPLYPFLAGVPVLLGLRPIQKLSYLAKLRRRYERIMDRLDIEGIG